MYFYRVPSPRPLSEYPLILIEWADSSRLSGGWLDLDEIEDPDPHTCVSVGFLVKEHELGKILVPTVADVRHTENRHTHGGIMIPRCSIVSERQLRPGRRLLQSD